MEIISDFDHRFTMKHGEKSQHGVAMKSMDLIVGANACGQCGVEHAGVYPWGSRI